MFNSLGALKTLDQGSHTQKTRDRGQVGNGRGRSCLHVYNTLHLHKEEGSLPFFLKYVALWDFSPLLVEMQVQETFTSILI